MSECNGFYFQTHEDMQREVDAAEHREHSEQQTPKTWIEEFLELGREMQEFHREFTKKAPF